MVRCVAGNSQVPKLIFLSEKFAGRVYEFAIEKTTVGRGDHNTLTIQDSSVSHSHCEILVYGTEVIVRDLGSSNGTMVDGKRLRKEQQSPLESGQIVKFGLIEARLDLSIEPGTDTVTGWTAVHSHVRYSGDKPKPATSMTSQREGAPVRDDHTLIVSPTPALTEKQKAVKPPIASRQAGSSRKGRLILVAVVIGAVVVLLCWLILAKYG